MSAIADASGLSRRSLFNHFPVKESLLFAGIEDFMSSFTLALSKRPIGERLLTSIEIALIEALHDVPNVDTELKPGPEVLRARVSEAALRYSRDLWAGQMESAIAGHLAEDENAQLKASLIGAVAAQVWAEFSKTLDARQSTKQNQATLERVLKILEEIFG